MNRIRFVVACFGCVLVGCGQDVYESRLATTHEYYAHVNEVNDNLVPTPIAHGTIALRPPKQFSPLLDNEETSNDETQPYYLGADLLGIVAAYQAGVLVDVNGQDEPRPAFIYILSNEPIIEALIKKENEIEPTEFQVDLQNRLSGAFGVFLEPGRTGDGSEPNLPFYENLPRPAPQGQIQYEATKRYTAIRFQPTKEIRGFDVPMTYELYMLDQPGDLQYGILIVAPEVARPDENLTNRFRMMLESVTLSPKKAAPGGVPGSDGTSSGPLAF